MIEEPGFWKKPGFCVLDWVEGESIGFDRDPSGLGAYEIEKLE